MAHEPSARVLALVAEYKATGEHEVVMDAFSAATDAIRDTPPGDPAYPECLNAASQGFFTLFQAYGGFEAIDGAMEIIRRLRETDVGASMNLPARVALRNEQWGDTFVVRETTDLYWSILHPDGRISYLAKDWSAWVGAGWPMGFKIETPDGQVREFPEDHFGDGWQMVEMVMTNDAGNKQSAT
jgi:hypothetical protein